jgi:hypothetical protein
MREGRLTIFKCEKCDFEFIGNRSGET